MELARRWRAMGAAENRRVERCEMDLPDRGRVGPRAAACAPGGRLGGADAGQRGPPCSGKPAAEDSAAGIGGRVVGFCNPFCRDKSAADADAWPKLAALLDGEAGAAPATSRRDG